MLLTLFGGSPPVPVTSHSSWGTSWGTSWGASWGDVGQPVELSARSGYWRLFYTNMQAAANAARATKNSPSDAAAPVLTSEQAPKPQAGKLTAKNKAATSKPKLKPQLRKQSKPVLLVVPQPFGGLPPEVPWSLVYSPLYEISFTSTEKRDIVEAPVKYGHEEAILLLLAA